MDLVVTQKENNLVFLHQVPLYGKLFPDTRHFLKNGSQEHRKLRLKIPSIYEMFVGGVITPGSILLLHLL